MNTIVLKKEGAQALGSVGKRGDSLAKALSAERSKQSHEFAHWFGLYACRNMKNLQVGGGWLVGWFRLMYIRWVILGMIRDAGFSCFGVRIRRFSWQADHGFTLVVILGQSAINIHTYPENGTVSVWIVTCPGEDDDGSATSRLEKKLAGYFGAEYSESKVMGKVPLNSYDNLPVGCN